MTRDAFIAIDEAATLLGVSLSTVRRWVAAGLLQAVPDRRRGRAKLYRVGAVYEAEMLARKEGP